MLGENIRKSRKDINLTLEQLAEKIGSSSGTISHIENGTRKPSLDMLNKISEALGKPVIELMNGDTPAENAYLDEVFKMAFLGNNDTSDFDAIMNAGDPQPVYNFVKLPVLGKIAAGLPVEAKENIIDYVYVPEREVANGSYFYLQVEGNSMINSGIKNGYRVLVRKQPDVESGEIAVVRVNSHDATLKRVKKIDGQIILYPDNPDFDPILLKEEGATIIGKVVKVEFDPNKKY